MVQGFLRVLDRIDRINQIFFQFPEETGKAKPRLRRIKFFRFHQETENVLKNPENLVNPV